MKRLVTALVLATVIGSGGLPAKAAGLCLLPPVEAPVVDPFREPSCPYCAGNRGIEYGPTRGTAVAVAAPGTVVFAGTVARVRYVVIDHGEGHRTTYGRLDRIDVRVGASVVRGAALGVTGSEFFFGLREGEVYVDPRPLLGTMVLRPHLVPLDGTNRRPGRPARLICP